MATRKKKASEKLVKVSDAAHVTLEKLRADIDRVDENIQTLLNEWAYARPYRSNASRLQALPRFVDFYNQRRPHTAIAGLVPRVAVNNVPEHHN